MQGILSGRLGQGISALHFGTDYGLKCRSDAHSRFEGVLRHILRNAVLRTRLRSMNMNPSGLYRRILDRLFLGIQGKLMLVATVLPTRCYENSLQTASNGTS